MNHHAIFAPAAALLAVAMSFAADDTTLLPTKDTRILFNEAERSLNGGQATRLQVCDIAGKEPEFILIDFDHAAIKGFLKARARAKVTGTLKLTVRDVNPATASGKLEAFPLISGSEWIEGSGGHEAAKAGEPCALFAAAPDKKWLNAKGKPVETFLDVIISAKDGAKTAMINSASLEISSKLANLEQSMVLDAALLNAMANQANCIGLVLFTRSKDCRLAVFSREQTASQPKLVLSAE